MSPLPQAWDYEYMPLYQLFITWVNSGFLTELLPQTFPCFFFFFLLVTLFKRIQPPALPSVKSSPYLLPDLEVLNHFCRVLHHPCQRQSLLRPGTNASPLIKSFSEPLVEATRVWLSISLASLLSVLTSSVDVATLLGS